MSTATPGGVHIPTAGERSGHCHDCPFFDVISGPAPTLGGTAPPTWGGICRANPPQDIERQAVSEDAAGISIAGRAVWPMVAVTDYCGRHPLRVAAYQEAVKELTVVVQKATREDKANREKAMRQAQRNLKS